ncbi:hypothetical protein RB200_37010 [Streptomyces sp. PmtG]
MDDAVRRHPTAGRRSSTVIRPRGPGRPAAAARTAQWRTPATAPNRLHTNTSSPRLAVLPRPYADGPPALDDGAVARDERTPRVFRAVRRQTAHRRTCDW